MKLARFVFGFAGVWGVLILTPLYWMTDAIGREYPPAITHTDVYFGALAVTIAWQIAFLIIAVNPIRFRPIMLAAMVEKFGYVLTMVVLYRQGQIGLTQLAVSGPDLVLGILFVAAYVASGDRRHPPNPV